MPMMGMFFRRHGKKLLLYTALALAIGCIAAVGYAAYEYRQMTREWYAPLEEPGGQPEPLHLAKAEGTSPQLERHASPKPLKPFLMLLIGIDSRDGERARSDTMMLAAVHPEKQRAYLISIPRDSFVELPGRGYDKLNHAMAYGGPKLVKDSLERFLDVKIDRYATIDFDGFRKIVDQLGGVEINVKKRMKYTDPSDDTYIDLQPGLQTLNGKQALDYARYRKSDLGPEDSDYERIVRQQEIVKALANKGDSVQAFFKAFKLMEILGQHVKTDLTEAEIASLLLTYYDPAENHLETDTLKGADERIWRNGIRGWYYLVPKQERSRVHQKLLQELKRT
jgi:LCP family protein required for cell wall assembly